MPPLPPTDDTEVAAGLSPQAAAAPHPPGLRLLPETGPTPDPPLRVLVAEDDAALREAVLMVLEPFAGLLELLEAKNGGEAVRIVHSERIHLAVFDYRMPRASGLEAYAELRRVNPAAPGILCTAEADETLRQDARRHRMHCVLDKPFGRRELLGAADSALRRAYAVRLRPAA